MKRIPPGVAATTPCLFATVCSAICLGAFLTTIYASSAVAKTGAGGLRAKEWVIVQATAGKIADLNELFPQQSDRKLSAHFLEGLLTGTLPGVKVHRNGVQITGAIIDDPIDLSNAQIPSEVRLEHCVFNEDVSFITANFARSVSFEHSTFNENANFNGVKVGAVASFRNVVFEGRVDFISANIANDFVADGARFLNNLAEATFNSMKVGGHAMFRNTVFEGPVSFGAAAIAGQFGANEAQFENKENQANFTSMKVGHAAFFKNAVFEGPVNFGGADIAGNFTAVEAQFNNPASKSPDPSARFGMKCGGQGLFGGATFVGPVSFADSSFLDLMIGDMKPGSTPVPAVDLSRTSIKRQLIIRKISIHNLVAPSLRVEGQADLTDLIVDQFADLSDGDLATLDLSRSVWPNRAEAFRMEGISYKYIRAASAQLLRDPSRYWRAAPKETESHEALLKLASQAAYTADVYGNLEAFFSRQGYRQDADRAFVAGKRRERKENLHGLGWLGSWLLDGLVGYGRRPWQAGIPCAVLVALGCVLFSPKKMEPQNPEDTPRVYNRFWYSLGLFLPVVNLQAGNVWKPKADQTFLRSYMRVHILLGWILVPLVLAALTGLIK
jgi:hypothetical protein